MEVLQRRSKCDRLIGNIAVLRISVPGRDEQERDRPVPGRAQGSANLSYNADPEDPEAGPPLDRAAEPWLHLA